MARVWIAINDMLSIAEDELAETFIRASGPGGQNVNKVATSVQLRFNPRNCAGLPPDVAARAERLAGRRLNRQGDIVIQAHRFRTQEQNRADARQRLVALLAEAAKPPQPPRRPTRPTRASQTRRLDRKTRRGRIKQQRRGNFDDD